MLFTAQPAHNYRSAWARGVLLWLLLAFSVSFASPLLQPKSIELVCTGTGSVKLLINGSDNTDSTTSMAPDCAQCTQASAPPPCALLGAAEPGNQVYVLRTITPPGKTWRTAPPLPARGPPEAKRA